jgi:hypothetical protein
VEDLEVGAVVEDAAARAGEDAPLRARRVVLEMKAEERDQLGMDGYRAGLAAGAVLELDSRVVSETSTVAVWCLWMLPRAIFCRTAMITPVLLARRCTQTGSGAGRIAGLL